MQKTFWLTLAAVMALVLAGCGGNDKANSLVQYADVTVRVSVERTTRVPVSEIKTIKLEVSGPYMNNISDTFDFSASTTVSKTYKIPVGIDRLFKMSALDVAGTTVYAGEKLQTIVAGANSVAIDLYSTVKQAGVNFNVTIPNVPARIGKIGGINFSPYKNGQSPSAGTKITEAQIRERLNIVKPYLTNGALLHYYGSTDGLEQIGKVSKEAGFFTIAGVWLSANKAENDKQIQNAISTANSGECDAVCVGCEVIRVSSLPTGDANATAGDGTLIGYMKQVKAAVNVPVTYNDIDGLIYDNPAVRAECEGFVLANFYPYWNGVSVDRAVAMFKENYQRLKNVCGSLELVIGETGWPTGGNTVGEAVPSPDNARRYFTQVANWVKKENIKCLTFEAFDEEWKAAEEGPQGALWGLFDTNGVLKPCYEEVL